MPRSPFSEAHTKLVQALIVARKDAGLKQTEVALRLQKPQSFVSKYERGERRLDVLEFGAIAVALGRNPGELLNEVLSSTCRGPGKTSDA
jgi:transcriptional regulator with XRE-family HTH domain